MKRIGVVGLGNIGERVASNLLDSGYEVHGFSRTKKDVFIEKGGVWEGSVQELVRSVDLIIHCLPSADVARIIVEDECRALKPGQIIIELTSFPLEEKVELNTLLSSMEVVMLDCEISGLPHMVTNRSAVIFQSGDNDTINQIKNVMSSITNKSFNLGVFGNATKMKLLANAMVFVHNMIGAEVLNLSSKIDIDPELVFLTLKDSAAGSITFTNKAPIMISGEFENGAGPFRHMFDLLPRVASLAENAGVTTPLISTALEYSRHAEKQGLHNKDIAAMITVLEQFQS
jgi:putative dehydrogenase